MGKRLGWPISLWVVVAVFEGRQSQLPLLLDGETWHEEGWFEEVSRTPRQNLVWLLAVEMGLRNCSLVEMSIAASSLILPQAPCLVFGALCSIFDGYLKISFTLFHKSAASISALNFSSESSSQLCCWVLGLYEWVWDFYSAPDPLRLMNLKAHPWELQGWAFCLFIALGHWGNCIPKHVSSLREPLFIWYLQCTRHWAHDLDGMTCSNHGGSKWHPHTCLSDSQALPHSLYQGFMNSEA